ncbi:unnamed protein product, partial [Amoebophrya sp. A120]
TTAGEAPEGDIAHTNGQDEGNASGLPAAAKVAAGAGALGAGGVAILAAAARKTNKTKATPIPGREKPYNSAPSKKPVAELKAKEKVWYDNGERDAGIGWWGA